ncbi:hypothetical protein K1719_019104 [Acacia pycnantha]|nr:hypothetical protein K1719_019104 [Acacia pycnantha]
MCTLISPPDEGHLKKTELVLRVSFVILNQVSKISEQIISSINHLNYGGWATFMNIFCGVVSFLIVSALLWLTIDVKGRFCVKWEVIPLACNAVLSATLVNISVFQLIVKKKFLHFPIFAILKEVIEMIDSTIKESFFLSPLSLTSPSSEWLAKLDPLWKFLCPSESEGDDPLINPEKDLNSRRLDCKRVLICVPEEDLMKDRSLNYKALLEKNGFSGKVDVLETKGENHVFHVFKPTCENPNLPGAQCGRIEGFGEAVGVGDSEAYLLHGGEDGGRRSGGGVDVRQRKDCLVRWSINDGSNCCLVAGQ